MFTWGPITRVIFTPPAVPFLSTSWSTFSLLVIQLWLTFSNFKRSNYIYKYFASYNPRSDPVWQVCIWKVTFLIGQKREKTAWYINKIYIDCYIFEIYNYRFKTLWSTNSTLIWIIHDSLKKNILPFIEICLCCAKLVVTQAFFF